MIPRILHHVWLGPNPLPPEFAAFRETWCRHHPDWEPRLWLDGALPPDLVRHEVYDHSRVAAERSDMLRLELLERFGGVYVDTDMECRRPLDELVAETDFFAGYMVEPRDGLGGRVGNAIIGAVPGHPILARAIERIRPTTPGSLDKAGTGTIFFTELVREFPDATIFDRRFFFPLTRVEQRSAFAVHHWSRSWKTPEELRASLFKAETRLAEANEELKSLRAELARLHARRRPRLPWPGRAA